MEKGDDRGGRRTTPLTTMGSFGGLRIREGGGMVEAGGAGEVGGGPSKGGKETPGE